MKFLTFSPWNAGFNNVLMSYELASALAHITNRILVAPRKICVPFTSSQQNDKNTWHELDNLIDMTNVLYTDEVFKSKEIEGARSYTEHMSSIPDAYIYKPQKKALCEDYSVFVSNIHNYIKEEDFINFSDGRFIEDLNRRETYLHFENCLFGQFTYHVYPGGVDKRNELKNKINQQFGYKQKFFDQAKYVKSTIGSYNALHLRRNDFLQFQKENIETTVATGQKLLQAIKEIFPNKLPIYIATDETNYEFFKPIRKEYDIYFWQDFSLSGKDLEQIVLEQCICENADYFIGTYFSTFTKRINILRGLNKKQAMDYGGINKIHKTNDIEKYKSYPWFYRPSKQWHWHDSSYLQWCME